MNKLINRNLKIPCEIYSRTVGFYRPISQWNNGKQSEFKDRKTLKVNENILNRTKDYNIDKIKNALK